MGIDNTVSVSVKSKFSCMYVSSGQLDPYNYTVEATVICPQRIEDKQMIMSFSDLKHKIDKILPHDMFIHTKGLVNNEAILYKAFSQSRVCMCYEIDTPSGICAESICMKIAQELQDRFNHTDPGVILTKLILRESVTECVTWTRD